MLLPAIYSFAASPICFSVGKERTRPELCPFNDNAEEELEKHRGGKGSKFEQLDHLAISGHGASTTTLDLMHCSALTAGETSPLCKRFAQ